MSIKPPQGLNAAFEDDPTGVRELLRGLPDPGPMPADVSDRIRDALAAETAARAPGRLHAVSIGSREDETAIRDLLRSQPDPGQMPDEVGANILAALAAEARARDASSDNDAVDDDLFENDRTGMRDLLRSQPSPGPMPEHLQARILKRFVVEQITAEDEDPTGMREVLRSQPDPGPMPDLVAARVTAALRHEADRRDERPTNVTALRSRNTAAPTSRSARLPRLVGGAVAAAVAGVIAIGTYQTMGNDAPPTQAVSSTSQGGSSLRDKVYVTSTDTNYTAASLPMDAGALARADMASGLSPADASTLGTVATKDGALSCAAAIGQEVLERSSRITVDIASYENKPALVVVATRDGRSTAWVLNRDCDKRQNPIAGPATVN